MKKFIFTCIILCLITYSFLNPENTINAARTGLQIWFQQILPALLPFSFLSILMVKSNFLSSFKGNANLISCICTLLCGFIFGFPIGAKLSADFYANGLLSRKQATILSVATNNFSPMYICGFALNTLFSSNKYQTITYILLYFVPLMIASIYLILISANTVNNTAKLDSEFNLNMKTIDECIMNSFESLIKICGYIVLFSIISEILIEMHINVFFLQNIEITNGIQLLSKCDLSESVKYILAIQTLSFGGLSGLAQACSIISQAGLSMHKYIIGKVILSLLLTSLSVIYVFIIRLL